MSKDLFDRASRVIPGGVNSPVRSFGSVGGTPYFVSRAEGPYIWDSEGKRYIDYVMSYGPAIAGHSPPQIIDAIQQASGNGTSYGAPTLGEIEMAEELCDRVDGVEMVRLVSSGTEATMTAIRLARGATGRNKIIKFAGHYHGHGDALLAAGGSGVANQGLSGSSGVPPGAVADTVVAPWNTIPEVDPSVAAVILEPVPANMGIVPPSEGYLQKLRDTCSDNGSILIFDEVITGFRLSRGGASQWFGVQPDLWCFGKVIGGGLPMGAYGGSADLLRNVAPLGEVYQAGTLSGNPIATAAGLAQLGLLTEEAYSSLEKTAERLSKGFEQVFSDTNFPAVVPRVGSLLSVFFTESAPSNFDEAKKAAENGVYQKFFHGMLQNGVAFPPGPYEALFPSLAHSDDVIDQTIETALKVVKEIKSKSLT
ncbi:MAG: glutamate-1-semialdehyde 2,1-aminomutase [Acidimicrobiales bacterium]|nr:glutamate-1-semialdehyde 2,1-aminomutase [Acidimicrobiales bacterium]MDG1846468.1 glutamate-1-semialdehyde 2,1-aminomutase [Acidimicrobiales bacterium]